MTSVSRGVSTPPTLAHESLASSAADWITSRILEGHIKPGEKLAEVGLAEQMGISRSPVREALRELARDGLIIVEPRRGAYVAELSKQNASDLYACRMLLEPPCIKQSVEAMTENDARQLNAIYDAMRTATEANDANAYVSALKDHNWALLSACPNKMLVNYAESAWRASLRYWDLVVRADKYLSRSLRRNRSMQTAIANRDGDKAAEISLAVLEFGRDEVLRMLSRLPAKG